MAEFRRRLVDPDPWNCCYRSVSLPSFCALGYLARRLFLRALGAWSGPTGSAPARILTDSLRGPTMIWAVILAAHLALESSSLPASVTHWIATTLLALWIFSLTLMGMRIVGDMVRFFGGQIPARSR